MAEPEKAAKVGRARAMRVDEDLWTAGMVKARLEEAADSLRRIRAARHTLPAGYVGAWPEVVQDSWDAIRQLRAEYIDQAARARQRLGPFGRRPRW